jgi:ABC-type nitrate/sulfonate/bicarbonate transport system permease component
MSARSPSAFPALVLLTWQLAGDYGLLNTTWFPSPRASPPGSGT